MIVAGFMVPHPPIMLPEVGHGEEKKIQQTTDAYLAVARKVAELAPETIVISSPHSVSYADYFHISPGLYANGDMGQFRAPQVAFRETYDEAFTQRLSAHCNVEEFPGGTIGQRPEDAPLDHGTMIPLYYIRKFYKDFKLVRLSLSGLSLEEHYRMGELVAETAEDLGRRVVFIGSGDLSHKMKADGPYGFAPDGPVYDDRIMEDMGNGAFDKLFDYDEGFLHRASECGHRSFVIMAGALDGKALEVQRFSHEATFGVGYGICSFIVKGDDDGRHFLDNRQKTRKEELAAQKEMEDAWVRLARASLESYILKGEKIRPSDVLPGILDEAKVLDSSGRDLAGDDAADKRAGDDGSADASDAKKEQVRNKILKEKAGAFVSLHLNGNLRGCIGTIIATTENVGEEIAQNAISAATADHRFFPVRKDEVPLLDYSVDVLSEPEPIPDASYLDVKRYGVIVRHGRKQGLLLPDLEGVDTIEEQIAIAAQKGGIREDEPKELWRFEVIRHK